jgi:hypothetical protein
MQSADLGHHGLRASAVARYLVLAGVVIGACTFDAGEPVTERRSAIVGEPIRTIVFGDTIDCSQTGVADHVAISVSAVPRKALPGVSGDPESILLGTNCRTPTGHTIYFFDPGAAGDAPVGGSIMVSSFVTSVTTFSNDASHPLPPNGWGATAYRGDQLDSSGQPVPDLIACGNTASDGDPHPIFRINLQTGEATFMFNAAGDEFPCDGLAWDAWGDTIYMGADITDSVHHYQLQPGTANWVEFGTPVPVPSPGCFDTSVTPNTGKSGVEVIGNDLLVACDGKAFDPNDPSSGSAMFILRQSDGAQVGASFPSGVTRAEDLECDRRTFASQGLAVAWTKDAFSATFQSFEVPKGSCGLCRGGEQERPLLNSLPADKRAKLANLLGEFITAASVDVHDAARSTWHAGFGAPGGLLFFAGHRGYLGSFEIWLLNVKSQVDPTVTEFVPLPKWYPGSAIPAEFAANIADVGNGVSVTNGVVGSACTGSGGAASQCTGIGVDNFSTTVSNFFFKVDPLNPTGPAGRLCEYASVQEVQQGGGGRPSFESFHNDVHNTGTGIGGTMAPVNLSSSSLIFYPWHAFVDDLARTYQCSCPSNPTCATCTDLFKPEPTVLPFAASGGAIHARQPRGHKKPGHGKPPESPSATANVGFWWWFEDQVFIDDPKPDFTFDRAGYELRGKMHGGARLAVGLVGQTLALDGRDDYVEATDGTVGNIGSDDFTLDAWVRTSAQGMQPIVSKLDSHDVGYELFIDDGELGLFLGTAAGSSAFTTDGAVVGDGQWHHVAVVVTRSDATGSGLFVDGQRLLTFDATTLSGDASNRTKLLIGRSDDKNHGHGHSDHKRCKHDRCRHHWHCGGGRPEGDFFAGQLDEIDLFRYPLAHDFVTSIFKVGAAGKYGSLGATATSLERPACVVGLGQMIAGAPPGTRTTAVATTYDAVVAALRAGRVGRAKALLTQLAQQANEGIDPNTAEYGSDELGFTAIGQQATACAQLDRIIVP